MKPVTFDYKVGDVRDVIQTNPDQSIHTIVTSPPYWGLRDYGIPPSIWGGDPECEHEWEERNVTVETTENARWQHKNTGKDAHDDMTFEDKPLGTCHRCGAWRGCLGLEPTPEMFIAHLVEVCRLLWMKLRPDGTFWLNIGDCYNSGLGSKGQTDGGVMHGNSDRPRATNLKHKDLVMMPHRVALALQADGWWVRSTIVWSKPNTMPESCTDRPTCAHEYIFLLTKSGKPTYWVNAYRELGTRKQPEPDYLY